VLVTSSIASVFTFVSQAAAAGSIYITPANPSVAHGSNVTLSLRINPTTPVTVVQATVNFNSASLQYVGIDSSSSPFDTSVQQTVSANSIQITRAKLDPNGISTDALIANITFKAIPYTGSSPVTLTGANAAYNGTYTNPSATGATVNFTPGTCPSGQVGTPPNCTTPAPTGGGTTTPPKTTPTPTNPTPATPTPATTGSSSQSTLAVPTVDSEDTSYTTFKVVAKTNVAAQARLVYGVKSDALNTQTDLTKSGTTHTLSVTDGLAPGSQIFYKVVSTDGKVTKETAVRSITLKGLSVKVALLDKNLKALTNQKVTLLPTNIESKSDGNGEAIFDGISAGDYTVQMVSGGKTYQQHITVVSNIVTYNDVETSAQQSLAVIFDAYTAPVVVFPLWIWIVIGAVLLLAIFIVVSWRKNGIVRTLYTRFDNFRESRKLKGAVAGEFAPVVGLGATPAIGSEASTLPNPKHSSATPSIDSSTKTEAPTEYAASHFNPFDHKEGPRHE
jgi:hypothetical protein